MHNNTSVSNNNTSENILLNNTLEDTPLTSEIPPIPPCFEGLEEQWADLNKNGRDFRKEIWFRTHIDLSRKEKITPLEHLANFFRRALQEESLDDSHEDLQEEDLDNEDFNYQDQTALRAMNNLSKRRKALVIRALIDISCATATQLTSNMFPQVQ
ncbi:11827_t:CDS:2, partial [Funneliformis geosporum]